MKSSIIILTILCIVSVATSVGAQRYVLCEMFTNTGCGPCARANPIFDNWLLGFANADRVAVIKYHVYWPDPDDPYHVAAASECDNRTTYYNVQGVPDMFMNGSDQGYDPGAWPSMVINSLADSSHFDIAITGDVDSTGGSITVTVRTDGAAIPSGTLILHTVIVESDLIYKGLNGDPVHNYVLRKMLPDANGETFSISPKQTKTFARSIVWNAAWKLPNCKIIAFVQVNETKEVLQAGIRTLATTPVLLLAPPDVHVSYLAGTAAFDVANGGVGTLNWSTVVPPSSSWISALPASGKNSGTVTLNYSQNSSALRSGYVQLSAPGAFSSPREFIVIQAGAPQGWITKLSDVKQYLTAIACTDSNTAYAAGCYNLIFRTTNRGDSWTSLACPSYDYLYGISFGTADAGVAVGYDAMKSCGGILRTTTGGAGWSSQTSGTSDELEDIVMVNATIGYAVGWNGTILKTTDGGISWFLSNNGVSSDYFMGVSFTNALTGTVVGYLGNVYRTTNGGLTWVSQSNPGGSFNRVQFTDANNGAIVGDGGRILRTTDGGSTWRSQSSGTSSNLYSVFFTDADHGIAVGDSGTIIRTTDGGTTWETQSSGYWNQLSGVARFDADNGVIIGDSLILYSSPLTGVTERGESLIRDFSLRQNYPNPFNPSTTISYQLPKQSHVTLKIFDILGREIAALVNGEQTAGFKSVTWSAANVPSGIYFYRITAGTFTETKKLLLLR